MSKIFRFLAGDKALHFLYSFLILLALDLVMPNLYAFGVTLVIGIAKEIYDIFASKWSWGDIVADVFGAIAALIYLLITN